MFSSPRRAAAARIPFVLLALLGLAGLPRESAGLEIWTGLDFYFAKSDSSDWTLPANQDRITDQVWITRQHSQGIFNVAQEPAYLAFSSPADTEWATGDAADWAALTFAPWQVWTLGNPPGTLGVKAVVHLISEDIYVDIQFDSWTCCSLGGGFAYHRGTPLPTPHEATTWGRIKALYQ